MKIEFKQMKIKVFLILLLSALFTNFSIAQNTLNNLSLTSSTPASVAYSLRLLSSSYAGPLVRIKVGTLFYDVYPDASNKFSLNSKISAGISIYNDVVSAASTNALSTIITGSTDAAVVIWYDQSGNNKHAASSNPGAKIIISGSIKRLGLYGNPTIDFTGNLSLLRSTSTVNYSAQTGATVNAIAQNTSTSFGGIIGTGYTSMTGYNISYSSGQGYISDGANGFYESGVISTDPKMITSIFTNKTQNLSKIYVNSILTTNIAGSAPAYPLDNNSNSVICIGVTRQNINTYVFKGNISEAIIFPKQLTAGEQSLLETNQNAFYFSSSVSISSSVSNTICSGTNVTFTSDINNFTNTPSYQWYKNGIAINGATSSTYSSTTLSNNDQINVIATPGYSGAGVSSNIITTTVAAPSVTVTSSASGAVCAGTAITFTATVCGIPTPTYQWYKNSTAITGATSSIYSTTSLNNNDIIYATATPAVVTASLVTSNLMTNLDAGNSSSYGGTGTTWTDLTGLGNKATLTGTGYSSVNGGGITFTTSKYATQTLTSPPFNGDFTWSTILKAPDYNTNSWDFLYNVGGYTGLNIALVTGQPRVSWGTWFSDNINVGGLAQMVIGNYYMLTFVRSGNTVSFYLQASPYGTPGTVSATIPVAAPLIARGPGSEWWENGIMNVMLLYNRALSQTEITQNYNTYASRFGLAAAGISSNTISTTISPAPSSTITVNGDGCLNKTSLTTASGSTSYAWYKDNVMISGITTNSIIPNASGAYHVIVTNGTCSSTSTATTIYTCGINADGKAISITNISSIISSEGGANFGTGKEISGKLFNTTGIASIFGTIGSSTAVIGGVISSTNAITTSIGVMYSTDINFGTYSSSTIQSNVTAGTYSITISGLLPLTTYYTKSFIVNKVGTNYGFATSFTTSVAPVAVGDSYGGGIVFYILQPADIGYVNGETHGLIAATSDQSSGNAPWSNNTNYTSAIAQNIGSGFDNTTKIISSQGSGTYAAKIARDYVSGGYSDWYLPSFFELKALIAQKTKVGNFNASWYWSSSESNNGYNGSTAPYAWIQQVSATSPNESGKSYSGTAVRPIRSF